MERYLALENNSLRLWSYLQIPYIYRIVFRADTKGFPLKYEHLSRGTQRPNVSKYTRSVSDGFLYTLEACLVNLELSLKNYLSVRIS